MLFKSNEMEYVGHIVQKISDSTVSGNWGMAI